MLIAAYVAGGHRTGQPALGGHTSQSRDSFGASSKLQGPTEVALLLPTLSVPLEMRLLVLLFHPQPLPPWPLSSLLRLGSLPLSVLFSRIEDETLHLCPPIRAACLSLVPPFPLSSSSMKPRQD